VVREAQSAQIYRLDGLASVLGVLLGISAAVSLVGIVLRPVLTIMFLLGLPLVTVFLVWFYRARQNAGHLDWPQRWSPGWSVFGWLVPICFLWIPYRIMADIWRAGAPEQRAKIPVALGGWWACWCLAWFTGYRTTTVTSPSAVPGSPPPTLTTTTTTHSLVFGGTAVSLTFAAAAAVMLAYIVRRISAGPVGGVGRF
jgi:hypothetical protein